MDTSAAGFDPHTPEDEIAAWVDACAPTDAARAAMVSLLPEQHSLYAGRGTNATARIRGYTLAAFERVGLPADALPYVLDELENGDDAYLVAAAAKALRGASVRAAVAFAIPFLETARRNVSYSDAPVRFDAFKPAPTRSGSTTATREIDETIGWIGEVDCCPVPAFHRPARRALELRHVELEDQDGRRVHFGEFFSGKPAVVAFFYSRCDNVRKCSLTITRLAALQRELASRGLEGRVRLSAITYDPLFDLPPRLQAYGRDRGVQFTDDVRFFRVPEGFTEVRDGFDLGVNYVGAIVNRHRTELYVLDAQGRMAESFTRLSWKPGQVADRVGRLLRRGPLQRAAQTTVATAASLTVALLPKCPLCFGAYASALGTGAIQLAPHRAWLLPVALALLGAHLVTIARRAIATGRLAPLLASAAGAIAVLAGSLWSMPPLSLTGATLLIGAAIASAGFPHARRQPA